MKSDRLNSEVVLSWEEFSCFVQLCERIFQRLLSMK